MKNFLISLLILGTAAQTFALPAKQLQIRRGLKANLPTLADGEPALAEDTSEFFIGSLGGNLQFARYLNFVGDSGSGGAKGLVPAPAAGDAAAAKFLKADGTWHTAGGSPGGANTQVQYNDSGIFAGDANFVWDKIATTLTVNGNIQPSVADTNQLGLTSKPYAVLNADFVDLFLSANSNHVNLAPDLATTSYILRFPSSAGSAGQVWTTNGDGTTHWTTPGGGSPGGANTNIQYNGSGSFAGSSDFSWNETTKIFTASKISYDPTYVSAWWGGALPTLLYSPTAPSDPLQIATKDPAINIDGAGIEIAGAWSDGTGNTNNIEIIAGSAQGTGTAGAINLTAGSSVTHPGGNISIAAGSGTQKGALQLDGAISMSGNVVTTVGTPLVSTDAATKGYVDLHGGGVSNPSASVQEVMARVRFGESTGTNASPTACTGTCGIYSQSGSWVSGIVRNGTGDYTVTFSGAFSAIPTCTLGSMAAGTVVNCEPWVTTTTTVEVLCRLSNVATDSAVQMICMGPK